MRCEIGMDHDIIWTYNHSKKKYKDSLYNYFISPHLYKWIIALVLLLFEIITFRENLLIVIGF